MDLLAVTSVFPVNNEGLSINYMFSTSLGKKNLHIIYMHLHAIGNKCSVKPTFRSNSLTGVVNFSPAAMLEMFESPLQLTGIA